MQKLFIFLLILLTLLTTGFGESRKAQKKESKPEWPAGSGYLSPPKNKPSSPHNVIPSIGDVVIIDVTGDQYLLDGKIEIRQSRQLVFFPGNFITHGCKDKPKLELPDYNGDKCTLLYGIKVRINDYGQYVFVKYVPNEVYPDTTSIK